MQTDAFQIYKGVFCERHCSLKTAIMKNHLDWLLLRRYIILCGGCVCVCVCFQRGLVRVACFDWFWSRCFLASAFEALLQTDGWNAHKQRHRDPPALRGPRASGTFNSTQTASERERERNKTAEMIAVHQRVINEGKRAVTVTRAESERRCELWGAAEERALFLS